LRVTSFAPDATYNGDNGQGNITRSAEGAAERPIRSPGRAEGFAEPVARPLFQTVVAFGRARQLPASQRCAAAPSAAGRALFADGSSC
jgi:hypothetical protein